MHLAVPEFGVVQQVFLGAFSGGFGHAGNCFALFLRVLYFLQHHLRHFGVLVQVVVQLLLYEVVHELVYAHSPVGRHVFAAQFHFCLALEHRLFHVDGYGSYHAVAYVCQVHVLVEELLDGAADGFAEGHLVCAALYRVLPVHKRIIFVVVLVRVGQGYLYVLSRDVDDGV